MIGGNPTTIFDGVRNEAVLLFTESDAGRAGPHVLHHHVSASQASPQAGRHRDALHQHDHRYVLTHLHDKLPDLLGPGYDLQLDSNSCPVQK